MVTTLLPTISKLRRDESGAAMMDSNLALEAYRLGQITAVGEAESVRRLWNSH
jgi:hypothetical protein